MSIIDFFRIDKIKKENDMLRNQVQILINRISALGADTYEQVQKKIEYSNKILEETNEKIKENKESISILQKKIDSLSETSNKIDRQVVSQKKKLNRIKELYLSVENCFKRFLNLNPEYSACKITDSEMDEIEVLVPSVITKLHCMDMKDLRKAYKENEKQIDMLMKEYAGRYTTKANKSIYELMVIALRSELQNILYNLRYEKLDQAIENVKNVSNKYLKIAADGNQSIAGTMTKFIGEVEYLFINAVKIEYNYYVKREQSRQEQIAIREKMRQEEEERRALEFEKKKVENEEAKYHAEIEKAKSALSEASEDEVELLKNKIINLQKKLNEVVVKKEEIVNLQNGKAGNVYIISNLGSFGSDVFKIGMTRRLDPQDRINELGNASVPFKFDVHSFIFSEDAVKLENTLHETLNNKRVNKVNLRKEFFKVSIDELEDIVLKIDPSAEFNRTMIAEEYRQSLSTDGVYDSTYSSEIYGPEEDEDLYE